MSWRSQGRGASAWRQRLAPLRQEAAANGFAARANMLAALEALKAVETEAQDQELAEDIPFLVQQLLGRPPSAGSTPCGNAVRDTSATIAFCRLLSSVASARPLRLPAPAANLVFSALRQWADVIPSEDHPAQLNTAASTSPASSATTTSSTASSTAATAEPPAPSPTAAAAAAAAPSGASLHLESLAALAALLPDHLGALSEHERAAQLAALQSLLVPHPTQPHARAPRTSSPSDALESQCLALTALAACCSRTPTPALPASSSHASAAGCCLTPDEAAALLAAVASLLQCCAPRSRPPVEDSAHCRLYAALLRALQAAVGEAKQAWVGRAGALVEGLQRFLMYGVQASLAAAATVASAAGAAGCSAGEGGGSGGAGAGSGGGGGGGRYRPPHLRRRESQADGGGGSSAYCSDSDMSDTEHVGGALGAVASSSIGGGAAAGAGAAGSAVVVDRFRSSRVRLAALSCVQAMARSDPRAMHTHWSALLPLQSPLQPRPLTPHLLTVLLYDPLPKVRALAASTLTCLLDGPAQRSILAVAEARSSAPRTPLRGFLTLSHTLGQLLLGAHAGLHAAVAREGSAVVLPGVLRALVALLAAAPYERLPPELLPDTIKVLRSRWTALLSAPSSAAAAGELPPIHAAYLACLAECLSTRLPIPGLAAYLQLPQPQPQPQPQRESSSSVSAAAPAAAVGANSNADAAAASVAAVGGGFEAVGADAVAGAPPPPVAHSLVRELLAVGRDPEAAAVLRIEALGALKGLAAHYSAALPQDVWDDLRATAAVGLTSSPAPRSSPHARTREGPPSRSSSSSSLSAAGFAAPSTAGTPGRPSERSGGNSWRALPSPAQGTGGRSGSGAPAASSSSASTSGGSGTSPEDKAAQLSVKLVSDYLAAVARQYGMSRTDASGDTTGDADGGSGGAPPPSPGHPRHPHPLLHQQQAGAVLFAPNGGVGTLASPAGDSEAGVRRLAAMWRDAVALLVPAATSHVSYMVRSAGLTCLGEVPEPVFSSLDPPLQQRVLALLSDAAAADTIPATRAAACKALGAAAAFPAVVAHADLSDQVTRALASCLRDSVLSVRIAAGWAVANLCDAYRRRLEEAEGAGGNAAAAGQEEEQLWRRSQSHQHASTSAARSAAEGDAGVLAGGLGCRSGPPLEPHHYLQLSALCSASIAATQDADKVRANGVRAVGNLLAALSADMAAGLAAGGGGGSRGPSGGGGVQLDVWLDSALTCLQSTLTTGGMKVQWNACYAVLGLLRNRALLAHPRVSARTAPLLLLLIMLVRDSANFKIRTHAAAALAALPSREVYGDVLSDALLVVAGALEGLNGGGAITSAGPATPHASSTVITKGGAAGGTDAAEGDADGGEGRFPNYRYAAGLTTQLRVTLLHLLALAQPADARRVRETLARRAEFLYGCLRDQLAEAVLPLRTLVLAAQPGGDRECAGQASWSAAARAENGMPSAGGDNGAAVVLPSDPFGLSGTGMGRAASPRDGPAGLGLAALLEGLDKQDATASQSPSHLGSGLQGHRRESASLVKDVTVTGGCSEGANSRLPITVQVQALDGGDGNEEIQQALSRVAGLVGPLHGFAELLSQLGPACEPLLLDVRQALGRLQPS